MIFRVLGQPPRGAATERRLSGAAKESRGDDSPPFAFPAERGHPERVPLHPVINFPERRRFLRGIRTRSGSFSDAASGKEQGREHPDGNSAGDVSHLRFSRVRLSSSDERGCPQGVPLRLHPCRRSTVLVSRACAVLRASSTASPSPGNDPAGSSRGSSGSFPVIDEQLDALDPDGIPARSRPVPEVQRQQVLSLLRGHAFETQGGPLESSP